MQDITEYQLVIIGSGIQMDQWTKQPEKFLKKFQKELVGKKVAIFVSSGAQALIEFEGDPDKLRRARKKYLEEKSAKYNLKPIALGLFGGVWDYNKMPWWIRTLPASKNLMEENKQKLVAAGFEETKPGIYDTRDWSAIQSWAKELAQKVHH